jgi:hypothetical protein
VSFSTATKDTMLNAVTITVMGAHTGFPGGTGANEVAGGTYARVACAFGASSGGTRSLTAAVNLSIPAGTTVRWLSLWNGSTFVGYSPNAGSPKEFMVTPSTDTFSASAHGYVAGQKVTIYGDTVPSGLTEGNIYFIVNPTTDTFQLSASSGGSVIDVTTTGGSACVVSSIAEESYAGGGTHTINLWTLGLPN